MSTTAWGKGDKPRRKARKTKRSKWQKSVRTNEWDLGNDGDMKEEEDQSEKQGDDGDMMMWERLVTSGAVCEMIFWKVRVVVGYLEICG